jgi:hypothetical protein
MAASGTGLRSTRTCEVLSLLASVTCVLRQRASPAFSSLAVMEARNEVSSIRFEGDLAKKAYSWPRNWQKRHFELDGQALKYFKGPGRGVPAGEGTVSGADNVPDRPGHRRNRIDIKMAHHVKRGGTSTIEAAADSPAEKARWLLGLRAAMAKKVDAGVLAWLTQIEPTLGVYASFAHFLLRFQVVFSGSDTFLHLHSPCAQ